jgi:hypothetical protein
MKWYSAIIVMVLLALIACGEKPAITGPGSLVLTGITSAKGSEMVTIDLDSGYVSTIPVNCHILSSTVYDPETGGYGYVSCDTIFTMVDTEDGEIIRSIRLPGLISSAVVDPGNNLLIGTYGVYEYIDDPDSTNGATIPVYHNYLLTTNLETGDIVQNKEIDLGEGVFLCTHFFDPVNKLYILQRADNKLLLINPVTGTTTKTVDIGKPLINVVYDTDKGNLISMIPASEPGICLIEVYKPATGKLISSKLVTGFDSYHYCICAYDPGTKCYLAVNSDNEVMFIEPDTGIIVNKVKLDYQLNDIRFLRKQAESF